MKLQPAAGWSPRSTGGSYNPSRKISKYINRHAASAAALPPGSEAAERCLDDTNARVKPASPATLSIFRSAARGVHPEWSHPARLFWASEASVLSGAVEFRDP